MRSSISQATLELEIELKTHLCKKLGKTKEERKRKVDLVRYADDSVVLANSKDTLKNRTLLHPNGYAQVHSQNGQLLLKYNGLKD